MSPSLRRLVVLMVLIAILVLDWRPDSRLLSEPAHRREEDRPLPEDAGGVATPAARSPRSAHLDTRRQRLPGQRQAARRRHSLH
ncbi:hypothetical protein [Melittangium boletus]|uniref:Uncharacterized protein n=1 Tax=Melittangium boletus DSM 14713 TaxID=1294270 RepID=A0A250IB24_9BACT|nr:hypothetical protein [Melittangium boletus]ATB29074.1 hypothetical protein MEBOL_002523 [Melittangium boletus DSM 14713]